MKIPELFLYYGLRSMICFEFYNLAHCIVASKMEVTTERYGEIYGVDISTIREAQVRISPYIHTTPVLSSETLNCTAGRKLYFKCECFQKG